MSAARVAYKLPSGVIAFRCPTSLKVPDNITVADLSALGRMLDAEDESLQWALGDWWVQGTHRYGDRARRVAQGIFKHKYQTLMDYGSVCRSIKPSIRIEGLFFSHHRVVAPFEAPKQKEWLAKAAENKWSLRELIRQIAQPEQSRTDEQEAHRWDFELDGWYQQAASLHKRFQIPEEKYSKLLSDETIAKSIDLPKKLVAGLVEIIEANEERQRQRQSAQHTADSKKPIRLNGSLRSGRIANEKAPPIISNIGAP